jgi:protein O-mannosyl-transferase
MSSAALISTSAGHAQTSQRARLPYRQAIGLSVILVVVTSLLYLPIVHDPFANIDDMGYVYENLHVQAGLTWDTVKWAARTFDDSNWHPLTWISHAVDCQLFGIDPAGHHAMAIVFHALDALVLFWVLLLATGFVGRSFMVAALFALHPINVESVAWAAERKTLLSTLFFLLALGAYRWYASRPGILRYGVVAALFALGLMAKPQIITLPCVLLLWDYWPLRRIFADQPDATRQDDPNPPLPPKSFWWLVIEKIPLLFICAASALATMKAQHVGHPQNWPYSTWIRVGNSIVAYVRYIGKGLWPSDLAIMYLHPGNSLRLWQVALAGLLLLAITVLVFLGRKYRYLPVGWLWFLGMSVPTIGLIQVGRQALADRYAYQSFLGLFILICWGVSDWARQKHLPKALLPSVSVAVLLVLGFVTHRQIGYWQDNLTLWTRALQVTDRNWMAEDMIAGLLSANGHAAEAMAHYRSAAAIYPEDERSNLAVAIDDQNHGQLEDAIVHYKRAIAGMDDPLEQAKAYQNLAVAYRDIGNIPQSVECLRRAVQLRNANR